MKGNPMEWRCLALERRGPMFGCRFPAFVIGLCCVVSLGSFSVGCSSSSKTQVASPTLIDGLTPEEWALKEIGLPQRASAPVTSWGYGGGQDERDLESLDDLFDDDLFGEGEGTANERAAPNRGGQGQRSDAS